MIKELYSYNDCDEYGLKMWHAYANKEHIPTYNHKHAEFEVSAVISGSGVYRTKDRNYPVKTGDVFVFASNEMHFTAEIGKDGMELLNLHFSPGFLGAMGINLSPANANFCFAHSADFQNRICREEAYTIRRNLLAMHNELKCKNPEYRLAVKGHLCGIILDLIRNRNYCDSAADTGRMTASRLYDAVKYIDNHFTETVTVGDLAGLTGITENYFSALFKKTYNISPNEYIISKRLSLAAAYLLEDGRQNILDIALKCGFNSTANFNKLFLKHYGITPSAFRNTTYY